ncbi:ROK family protein [Algiphilus sp.]|uniref:ROK family protein n=1 Tax=Algiphilus sp. TaxID=1872431 RepID=UPI001CA74860|nr:ROK family protein [Algiphilus sp.]MBY8965570.1 ROK family protein [Algiphilus acroporae]MCI5062523.1 ROK family protein [Algiphilus sp.]MCI5102677.1 ROK family protein [Algiphilus sp.]MCR9090685.1 ROK family protein [Pseudomonadota bacterium]
MAIHASEGSDLRIGVDLGGTKIEVALLDGQGAIRDRRREPTPAGDYGAILRQVATMVSAIEAAQGRTGLPVGAGTPGAVSRLTGRMKNSNSLCLNGRTLREDLSAALGRDVRIANDADCFALSEAMDGAAAGAACVFGVILGTGVGGGVVVGQKLLAGPNGIAGEWGHNPLPWPRPEWGEVPGPKGWDGRYGSIETWCCGPGMVLDHQRAGGGEARDVQAICQQAAAGDAAAQATLERWEDRLARSLASIINVLDPDVIVLGGGLSHIARVYEQVPLRWREWVFSDAVETRLVRAEHGDASGVRGAAWLWPLGRTPG